MFLFNLISFALLFCGVKLVNCKAVFSEYPETVLTPDEMTRANETTMAVSIRMTAKEVALFQRYLYKSSDYFEFGCGGSTIVACKTGPPALTVTSVDSNQEWVDIVLSNPNVAVKTTGKLLQMSVVDIGPVGSWGFPTQSAADSKGAWYMYSQAISMTGKSYDLVLVDGRFRVACLLNSFISNPKASVLIHDFFDPGHHHAYAALLTVSDVVDRADTLVALRPKAGVRKEDLMKMYATFIHVPERRR